jgi:hypothetical protein
MEPKAPAILLVLVESVRLRWFVGCVDLDGRATPLICSEVNDLEKYRGLDFDEAVAFLRHRFCGALQRGCDRLWARNRKACQFVFVFEAPLAEPTGELTRAVARHFAEWLLNPPVAVFAGAGGFDRPELLAGRLDPPLADLLHAHLGELLAAKEDPVAWEQARKGGAWCIRKDEG